MEPSEALECLKTVTSLVAMRIGPYDANAAPRHRVEEIAAWCVALLVGLALGLASWHMTEGQPRQLVFVLPPFAYTIGLVAMSITKSFRLGLGLAGVIATNLPTAFFISPALKQEGTSAALLFGILTTLLPMTLLWLLKCKSGTGRGLYGTG